MRDQASRTAEQVALFRALETARGHDRVFDDPLAVRFLQGGYRVLARAAQIGFVGRWLEKYIDRKVSVQQYAGEKGMETVTGTLQDAYVGWRRYPELFRHPRFPNGRQTGRRHVG